MKQRGTQHNARLHTRKQWAKKSCGYTSMRASCASSLRDDTPTHAVLLLRWKLSDSNIVSFELRNGTCSRLLTWLSHPIPQCAKQSKPHYNEHSLSSTTRSSRRLSSPAPLLTHHHECNQVHNPMGSTQGDAAKLTTGNALSCDAIRMPCLTTFSLASKIGRSTLHVDDAALGQALDPTHQACRRR